MTQIEFPNKNNVRNVKLLAVVDTGTTISVIPLKYLGMIHFQNSSDKCKQKILQTSGTLDIVQIIEVSVRINKIIETISFHVVDTPLTYCLLSLPHMKTFKLKLDVFCNDVYQNGEKITYQPQFNVLPLRETSGVFNVNNCNIDNFKSDCNINHTINDVTKIRCDQNECPGAINVENEPDEYPWSNDTLVFSRNKSYGNNGNEKSMGNNFNQTNSGVPNVNFNQTNSGVPNVKPEEICIVYSGVPNAEWARDEKKEVEVDNLEDGFKETNGAEIQRHKSEIGDQERCQMGIQQAEDENLKRHLFSELTNSELNYDGGTVSEKIKLIEKNKLPLTRDQENQLDSTLRKNQDVFSVDKYDIGCIKLGGPRVHLTSELPIAMRPYRASPKENAEIKNQIDKLLEAGFIKPSYSNYASPVTLAFKREEGGETRSKTRLCIDYRKINLVSKTDKEPVPRIDHILDQLSQARYYSTIDLTSGYWQLELAPMDTEKLAFVTNYGLFEWLRAPFGWKNSGALFQRAIRQILNKHQIQFACNYFDDIIVFSNNFEEHMTHLQRIFEVCRQENIKLNLAKCHFAKTSINFLGYEIKDGVYSPSNPNIETIKRLLPPKSVKELQRFLGSVNVYNKFIPQYAKIRCPLNNLLKKGVEWKWTQECQDAYEKLKSLLTTKPVLSLFNPDLPCHLFVDASGEAVAAVVKQEQTDGSLRPISFHSRQLKGYESRYAVTELECLAIIDAVEKFHCYLHGNTFTIHTDHAALIWLGKVKHLTGRLFRWSLRLSMYDYIIKYTKGSTNYEADMLSRNPVSHHVVGRVHLLTKIELERNQGEIDPNGTKYQKTEDLWTVKKKGLTKIVVPSSLKLTVLEKAHLGHGHPGIKKMLELISPAYYWTKIHTDIVNYVKHCEVCQLNKKSHQRKFGILGSLPHAKEPYDILSIDTVGGLGYYNSTKSYLHVVVDHATRYVWTFPSKSLTTETYTNILTQLFRVQTPKMLLSDRHASFTASKFRRFLARKGVKQLCTGAHRPQCNGRNESINGVIMSRLRCKMNESDGKTPWTKFMGIATEEYNNSPHSITRFTPNFLMLEKLPYETPIDGAKFPYPPIGQARKLAEERTLAEHIKSKARYDARHLPLELSVGDTVMHETFRFPNTRKLEQIYTAPYRITKKTSASNFEISKINQGTLGASEIVNASRLRRFFPYSEFKLQEE